MATNGVLGNGTKVGYSSTSPVTWTAITQLMNVDFPPLIADDVDTSVHGTSKFKRSMPGKIEAPEMTLELLADLDQATNATHEFLRARHDAQNTIWWRIEIPVNRAITSFRAFEFEGYVKEWTPTTPIEDKQTLRVVIRFDGAGLAVSNAAASAM